MLNQIWNSDQHNGGCRGQGKRLGDVHFSCMRPFQFLVVLLGADVAVARFDATVFRNYSEGYNTFRIPNLIQTRAGSLVALAEGRARIGFAPPQGNTVSCYGEGASVDDWQCTNKDIVLKRSMDAGRTWQPVQLVPGAAANDTYYYSNPNALVDLSRGLVFLMYSRCAVATGFNGCMHVLKVSRDDCASWEDVEELACSSAIGGVSGGIVMPRGRFIFPDTGVGAIYSDGGGAAGTWICGSPSTFSDENMVAVLEDGRTLLMTIRGSSPLHRYFATSQDSGASWGPATVNPGLWEPNCQASMIAANISGSSAAYFLLFANPHTNITDLPPDPYGRFNVTVQRSDDSGATWRPLLLVTPLPSAYTSMYQLRPGGGPESCGILYEQSIHRPVDFLSVQLALFDCETGA